MKIFNLLLSITSILMASCGSNHIATSSSTQAFHNPTTRLSMDQNAWTRIGTYSVEGVGIQQVVVDLPQQIGASYLKFDVGFGGTFPSDAFVSPHVGPTVNLQYGIFGVNGGLGSVFNAIAFNVNLGSEYGRSSVNVSYTTEQP